MIDNDFLLLQCTDYALILKDVESAFCDAATRFSGLFQIHIKGNLLKDS
jgi:hypothetical protein